MKYELNYISGGGTTYKDGEWEYSETPTFHVFKRLTKNFYVSAHIGNDIGDKIKLVKQQYKLDDTFYPKQAGIPHFFKSLD